MIFYKKQSFFKDCRGMTLVETTVAMGIIIIGVMASLTLLLSSFNSTGKNEQEIVVVNIAREGIEILRALRNNRLDNNNEPVDIFDGSYDGLSYIVDSLDNFGLQTTADDTAISFCGNCQLFLKDGRYVHDPSGSPTTFKRLVRIENYSSHEKVIVSIVSWQYKGHTSSYLLETHLTNWTNWLDSLKLFN